MTDHPTSRDITDGFPDGIFAPDVFSDVTDAQRETIVHLLARASEMAYRRGFQQGESIGRRRPEDIRADIAEWRYGPSTDDSPWADGARIETATDRLFTENKHLRRLGLSEPMADAIMPSLRHDPTYRPRGSGKASD